MDQGKVLHCLGEGSRIFELALRPPCRQATGRAQVDWIEVTLASSLVSAALSFPLREKAGNPGANVLGRFLRKSGAA